MRGGIGIGVAVVAVALACSATGFVCEGDDDCVLSGEPGVCLGGGQCAYPDPECPSGLSYPQGAHNGQAGECVSGDPVATGTDGSSSGEASTGSLPPLDDTGEVTTTGVDPGTTGPDEDTTTGSTRCVDPTEPNDDPDAPDTIDFSMCEAVWDAAMDPMDQDWFVLVEPMGGCGIDQFPLYLGVGNALEVCGVPNCEGAMIDITSCSGQISTIDNGNEGCCATDEVELEVQCGGASLQIEILVQPSGNTLECTPYEVEAVVL